MKQLLACLLISIAFAGSAQPLDSLSRVLATNDLPDTTRLQAGETLIYHYAKGPVDSLQRYVARYRALAQQTAQAAHLGTADLFEALALILRGDTAAARQAIADGIATCLAHGQAAVAAEHLLEVGSLFAVQGQLDQARATHVRGAALADRAGSQRLKLQHLYRLGYSWHRAGQHQRALPRYQEVLAMAQAMQDSATQVKVLGAIATVYLDQGELAKSLRLQQQTLDMAQAQRDTLMTTGTLCNIANVYLHRGNFEEALAYYQRALRWSEAVSYPERDRQMVLTGYRGNILANLGIVYGQLKDSDKALLYFQRAMDLGQATQNGPLLAASLSGVAGMYLEQEQDSLALRALQRGVPLARQFQAYGQVPVLLNLMVDIYLRQGQLDSARSAAQEAAQLSRQVGLVHAQGQALAGLAKVSLTAQDYAAAETYAQQAATLAQANGNLSEWVGATEWLWQSQQAQGKYQAGLQSYQRYVEARDSLNRADNQRAVIQFEYQQKALQDSLAFVAQQADTELAYQRQLAQRNYLLLAGLGLALLAGLGFYFWQQRRLRLQEIDHQKTLLSSTILTQEKERQRIAQDLHDSVGAKLNVMNLFLHRLTRRSPEIGADVQDMLGVVGDTVETTRRISHDLLPPTLEKFGLATAIAELTDQLDQVDGPTLQVEREGERPAQIDPLIELNLFRVLQELLSNTLKYARAERVSIRLIQSPEKLILHYRDDGQGFAPQAFDNRRGMGMQNIQSRLQMIGGQMDLQSAPGQGVQVQLEVGYRSRGV